MRPSARWNWESGDLQTSTSRSLPHCDTIAARPFYSEWLTRTWQEPAPRPTNLKSLYEDGNDHCLVLIRFTFKSLNSSLWQQRYVPLPSINWIFWQHKHFLKNKTQCVTLEQGDPIGRKPICTCFTVMRGVNNHPTPDDGILQRQICSTKCGWHHFLPTLIEYRCWFILVDEENSQDEVKLVPSRDGGTWR